MQKACLYSSYPTRGTENDRTGSGKGNLILVGTVQVAWGSNPTGEESNSQIIVIYGFHI